MGLLGDADVGDMMKRKRVRIESQVAERLSLTDMQGRPVLNPTVAQFRAAVVGLAEESGSRVIKMSVDGIFVAILMAGDDEVPDELAVQYGNHLVELAHMFVKIAEECKALAIAGTRGGST